MRHDETLRNVQQLNGFDGRILTLLALLQQKVGIAGSFRISTKCISWAIGWGGDPITVWYGLMTLEAYDLVEIVKRGDKNGRANEYRCRVSPAIVLEGRASKRKGASSVAVGAQFDGGRT
jgi:hypothetical protein